jgi:hypothetical protein
LGNLVRRTSASDGAPDGMLVLVPTSAGTHASSPVDGWMHKVVSRIDPVGRERIGSPPA